MLIDLSSNPRSRELRWFAGLWFPALCLVVGLAAHRNGLEGLAYVTWVAGVALGLAGLLRPSTIRPVYTGLILITFPIGLVISNLLLLAMFFLVVTPIGWLVRRFHDPMDRAFDRQAISYWTTRDVSAPDRYFNQF
jgi:Saxitoxin biosynthesis operon protein SxtJ